MLGTLQPFACCEADIIFGDGRAPAQTDNEVELSKVVDCRVCGLNYICITWKVLIGSSASVTSTHLIKVNELHKQLVIHDLNLFSIYR